MKPNEKSPDYYLDWVFRIHEEECAKRNYLFSEGGKAAFRRLWWRQCEGLVTDPSGAENFNRSKAVMHHKIVGIGQLTAIAPTFSRSMAIGAKEVLGGYKAYLALSSDQPTIICPTLQDVQAAERNT